MRALAHPLRLRLLGALRTDGPATATVLARQIEGGVPLLSYHLNQLAKHGFIELAPELARDGRERWWKAAHELTTWSWADFLDTPERIDAAVSFNREILHLYVEAIERFLAEQHAWGRDWLDAADLSDYPLDLSAPEAAALVEELHGVVRRWRERASSGTNSEHVRVILATFPFRGRRSS